MSSREKRMNESRHSIKFIIKFILKKVFGEQNYLRIAQLIWKLSSTFRSLGGYIKKILKYLKFKIKGQIFKQPVRILITRYSGLGDVLLTTPSIRILKKIYPHCHITFDTSEEGKELLEGNPYIDEITIRESQINEDKFDWRIHLTYEYSTNLHIIDSYLKLIGVIFAIRKDMKKPIIVLPNSDIAFAQKFFERNNFNDGNLIVGVHAQAGYAQRRWPLENFAKVLNYLEEKYGAKFIEFGINNQPIVGKGVSLVGKCTLKQSAAVLQRCSLLICNDSLMLHIAGALDVPVVGTFGPTPPWTRLPFNDISFGCYPKKGCRGCNLYQRDLSKHGMSCEKSFPECMYSIKPKQVIETVEKLLKQIGKNKSPKVSVIMSVYNGEKYLREAIDSILNQTFKDFEFLIINDGSTDSSREIILSYDDPRIRLIDNKKNIGLTRSLNKGIQLARGEYIARQDADDISLPERFMKQVKYLDGHRNVGLLGCGVAVIDERNAEVKRWEIKRDNQYALINSIAHGSVMIRAHCLKEVGGYRKELKYVQDKDLWYRLAIKFDVDCFDEYLYNLRRPNTLSSITQRNSIWQGKYALLAKELAEERRIKEIDRLDYLSEREIKKILPRLTLKDRINQRHFMSDSYYNTATKYLKKGEKKIFLKYIWKSIIHNPFRYYAWVFLIENFKNRNLAKILRRIKRSLVGPRLS